MAYIVVGADLDIYDTFETDIQLAGAPGNGQLRFRLERPDGTLAINVNHPDALIIDKGGDKFGAQFRVDMAGIWYWDWKPDGNLAAFVQGWFRVIPTLIGNRTIP